jgi:hypothetical protein
MSGSLSRPRWGQLIGGILCLLLCPASIYLARALAKLPDVWKYAGLAVLAAGGYCLCRGIRSLWRFLRMVGWIRLVAVTSLILGITIVGMSLADNSNDSFAQRVGRAVEFLLAGSGRLVGKTLRALAETGGEIFHSYVPPRVTPTPAAETPIAVGNQVVVDRISGQRLLARSQPGVEHDVSARFARDSILLVVDGPVSADGHTWWKLKGGAGTGWCSEDWVSLVSSH